MADGKAGFDYERDRRQTQLAVWLIAVVVLAIGLAVAYWIWPSGIMDLSLSAITFGTLLMAIGSGAIALVSCVAAMLLAWDA